MRETAEQLDPCHCAAPLSCRFSTFQRIRFETPLDEIVSVVPAYGDLAQLKTRASDGQGCGRMWRRSGFQSRQQPDRILAIDVSKVFGGKNAALVQPLYVIGGRPEREVSAE
jgi:hypothetical protein